MIPATKKWLFLKISSLILLPLMFWLIVNLVNVYDKNHSDLVIFLTSQPSSLLISLFFIFAYLFSAISISEVFEDYITNEKIKNAANKALNLFAIIVPVFTIILIFNLST
tara:strand:+ start:1332 stop:1661 length:330 start_codon:yes stop_codon:yes gene_type:complete